MAILRLSPTGSELSLTEVAFTGSAVAVTDGNAGLLADASVTLDSEQNVLLCGSIAVAATAPITSLALEYVAIDADNDETVIATAQVSLPTGASALALPAQLAVLSSEAVTLELRGTPTGGDVTVPAASLARAQILEL